MPELPEVETVRRGLASIVGTRVVDCQVRRRDFVRDLAAGRPNPRRGAIEPSALLAGTRVKELVRKGKQLGLIGIDAEDGEWCVVLHLGMSGQVTLTDAPRIVPAKHVHVVWRLEDGRRLVFRDARRFGKVVVHGPRESLERAWAALGPDGRLVTSQELSAALSGTRRPVKGALLDQTVVAGVGNIYADEALFEARIDPTMMGCELTGAQIGRMTRAIHRVLERAIEAKGSTLRDYRGADNEPGEAQRLHKVYGRAGASCVSCGGTVLSMVLAQRTTSFCPTCQHVKIS